MKNISVIGSGTMGNGIAQTFALFNFNVRLYDINSENLKKGKQTILKNLQRMVNKEKITVAISASIFIIAFTWVSIKGDLRKLANELIEDNENNQNN